MTGTKFLTLVKEAAKIKYTNEDWLTYEIRRYKDTQIQGCVDGRQMDVRHNMTYATSQDVSVKILNYP